MRYYSVLQLFCYIIILLYISALSANHFGLGLLFLMVPSHFLKFWFKNYNWEPKKNTVIYFKLIVYNLRYDILCTFMWGILLPPTLDYYRLGNKCMFMIAVMIWNSVVFLGCFITQYKLHGCSPNGKIYV